MQQDRRAIKAAGEKEDGREEGKKDREGELGSQPSLTKNYF